MGVERFANARLNGHFEHSHLLVFKQKLVIFWRRGQSIILRGPPLVEVSSALPEQKTGAKSAEHQYNVCDSFHGLLLCSTVRMSRHCIGGCAAKYGASVHWTHDTLHARVRTARIRSRTF